MAKVPWSVVDSSDNITDMVDTWNKLFLGVINKHAPIREKRVKYPTIPEWWNEDIELAIKIRDKYKKGKSHELYKQWRNRVTYLIRSAKREFYNSM